MLEIFRGKIGAKIVLGYLASVSLLVIIGVLVVIYLAQVAATVNDLATYYQAEIELSQAMVNQIALVRFRADRYIRGQDRADLEAYHEALASLDDFLAQADRTRQDVEVKQVSAQAFVAQTQRVLLTAILGAIVTGLLPGWLYLVRPDGQTLEAERKRVEAALRESEENFRTLFRTNPFPLFIARAADGFLIQLNQALLDYMEISPASSASMLTIDYYAYPADRQAILNEIETNGRVTNRVLELKTGQGRSKFALVNILPLEFSGESCLLTGLADITERKQMEEALLQAKTVAEERSYAAEAANLAKSTFFANISHELRTPLNAILGFSDLMAHDASLSAEQQENLTIINRSGEHLLSLINNVLDMAKIESGRMVLQEQVFDLHHLLNHLADMFRLRAADKGLTLIVDYEPETPRYVYADDGKLRQVLINLLGNTIKFTSEGGIGLRVRCIESGRPGFCQLRFEVQDTGPGIAPEDLENIFEPFVQSTGRYRPKEGAGLGLFISRQFARLMGGELAAESSGRPGQGALFKFDIPVELAKAAADLPGLQKQERPRAIGLEPGQPAAEGGLVPGGPYRLLVVEDRDETRQLLVKLLTQFGFEVRAAANGLEGVNVWREWQPHLIWMDMRMPVMDGHEATRQIKATPQGQATIIIALTATAFEDQRELILSEGCDGFVRKPFRESDIVDALVKHLGVRFIYESESVAPLPAAPPPVALDLAGLPAGWVAGLKQATIEANANGVVALTEQIREQKPMLAAALVDRINNFDLDAILGAISILESQEAKDEGSISDKP